MGKAAHSAGQSVCTDPQNCSWRGRGLTKAEFRMAHTIPTSCSKSKTDKGWFYVSTVTFRNGGDQHLSESAATHRTLSESAEWVRKALSEVNEPRFSDIQAVSLNDPLAKTLLDQDAEDVLDILEMVANHDGDELWFIGVDFHRFPHSPAATHTGAGGGCRGSSCDDPAAI